MASPVLLCLWLIALLPIWLPPHSPAIFSSAELGRGHELEGEEEEGEHILGDPIFGDQRRVEVLRKVLRQSGFGTEREIDEAIIALGPPPKKRLRELSSDEFVDMDEKQQNLAEQEHKAKLRRRSKRLTGENATLAVWPMASAANASAFPAFHGGITRNGDEQLALAGDEQGRRVNFTLPREEGKEEHQQQGRPGGGGGLLQGLVQRLSHILHISP